MRPALSIDSGSVGDAGAFQDLALLEGALGVLPEAPRSAGRVVLIVRRGDGGRRELLERVSMTPASGVPGDAWGRQRKPLPEAQLAVMQAAVAELIAGGQPLALFGDNLFLDLDLSAGNLPPGSRLRAGGVILEVTPLPHNGCVKFRARFGQGALRFVSKRELRHRNLRGVYMRVVRAGDLGVGDPVEVIERAGDQRPEASPH